MITPVPYSANFTADSVIAIAAAVLLLLCVVKNKRLARAAGILMLAGYAGYFVYLLRFSQS